MCKFSIEDAPKVFSSFFPLKSYQNFQIHETIEYYASYLKAEGFRAIRSCLAIGGVPSSEALEVIRKGVHILVATPGRLMDMLNKKMVTLDVCRYLCLDEAGEAQNFY